MAKLSISRLLVGAFALAGIFGTSCKRERGTTTDDTGAPKPIEGEGFDDRAANVPAEPTMPTPTTPTPTTPTPTPTTPTPTTPEPTGTAAEPTGTATEPTGTATEPTGTATEPTDTGSKPRMGTPSATGGGSGTTNEPR